MRTTAIVLAAIGLGLVAPVAAEEGAAPPGVTLERATPAVDSGGTLVENVGFETLGGRLTPVLRKGQKCPCERTVSYSNALDGQSEIPIHVFRGTGPSVGDASLLGRLAVRGFEPQPAGRAHVRVTVRVEEGAIALSAVDALSGESLAIEQIGPLPAAPAP